jgi:hypothetical protein
MDEVKIAGHTYVGASNSAGWCSRLFCGNTGFVPNYGLEQLKRRFAKEQPGPATLAPGLIAKEILYEE